MARSEGSITTLINEIQDIFFYLYENWWLLVILVEYYLIWKFFWYMKFI